MARLPSAAPLSRRARFGAALRGNLLVAVSASTALAAAGPAAAQKARISDLTDVSFGTLSDLSVDTRSSQSICIFSDSATRAYNVTAAGGGANGAFTMTYGAQALAYEVEWSALSGQTTGTQLTPYVPLPGQTSVAAQQSCRGTSAPSSASLTIILRSSALSSAMMGTYSGTLSLTIAPE